jgi:hypothetical protein
VCEPALLILYEITVSIGLDVTRTQRQPPGPHGNRRPVIGNRSGCPDIKGLNRLRATEPRCAGDDRHSGNSEQGHATVDFGERHGQPDRALQTRLAGIGPQVDGM